jgi:cyclopropane-fatty-acyl-phospholipid synthase
VSDESLKRSRSARVLDNLFQRMADRFAPRSLSGSLTVRIPGGREITFGHEATGPQAKLILHDYSVIRAGLKRGGLGFAESYMAGRVDTPDLTKLFDFFISNFEALRAAGGSLFKMRLPDRLWHLLRDNSRKGSKRNIEAHYDLGNDFYALWLDPSMTYSSAIFATADEDLEKAQLRKYDHVLKAIDAKQGDRVLEIGCGWGGFAERAAQKGLHVHGITLSQEQLAFTRARMERLGLADRSEFEIRDYRDTQGQYDKVASIEMIEAVGESHWPSYFRTIHDRLKPGGLAAVQAITIAEPFFADYRRKVDFIQRYIFPGGMLLTPATIAEQAEKAGLKLAGVETFADGYARTLQIWRQRFEAAWPQIAKLGFDERFRRMWRYYLCYCEAGFAERTIDVGIYRIEKPL